MKKSVNDKYKSVEDNDPVEKIIYMEGAWACKIMEYFCVD